jgi:multidrug transporter EmrE-like cation transporter
MTQSDRRLLSLVFLCGGILDNFGNISAVALICVLLSLALCVQSLSERPLGPALPRWAGIALVLALAATTILYNKTLGHPVFAATFGLLAVAVLLYSLVKARATQVAAFVLAGFSALIGLATNITWGRASIDVFQFQQVASQALVHGQNPYSPVVQSPEIVTPGIPTWLPLHLPYGPVVPVLEVPFRLLGDIRVLHAMAAVVTMAAVLTLARRAGTLNRSACVVMAFPLTVGMVVCSWVDVITMAGLAVWMVSFRSHPRVATFALVLALGVKPTTMIALVPIFFWSVRARRQVVVAGAITAVFVLPFAVITGFSQFYYNVLGVQLDVHPWFNALTVNSYIHAFHLPSIPFAVSALVVVAATALVLRGRPSTYGELLTETAILATVSFLVAKWAYFNYYYIPAVLLMLAIAGNSLALDVPEMIRPPAVFLGSVAWGRGVMRRLPGGYLLSWRRLPRSRAR